MSINNRNLVGRAILTGVLFLSFSCLKEENSNSENVPEKYLIVQPQGGLANRLRVLASASVMAKVSKRRLILDWRIDSDMGASWSELFQNKILSVAEANMPQECINKYGLVSCYSGYDMEGIYKKFSGIPSDGATIVYIYTCHNFSPDTLAFDDFLHACKAFYLSLNPVEKVKLRIEEKLKEFVKQENIVGIHYRSWKTSVERQKNYNAPPVTSLELLREQVDSKINISTQVFFASEDLEAKKNFSMGLAKIIFSEERNFERNTLESTQGALVDWFLLTKTAFLVGTYQSSFSDEAALITLTGKKFNVGPKHARFHSIICFGKEGLPFKRPYGNEVEC